MPVSVDLFQEPVATLLTAALSRTMFADLPAERVDPALGVFAEQVRAGLGCHSAAKRSLLTAGMLTMCAATRATRTAIPTVATALTAGVAASAAFHAPHLLDVSTALTGRKNPPPGWTVGAELVTHYLVAVDVASGAVARVASALPGATVGASVGASVGAA